MFLCSVIASGFRAANQNTCQAFYDDSVLSLVLLNALQGEDYVIHEVRNNYMYITSYKTYLLPSNWRQSENIPSTTA